MNYVITFSPTGGVERCARLLADSLFDSYQLFDFATPSDMEILFCKNDLVIIAFPSFGGRCPQLAIERLKRIRGNGAKAIAMVVYGNRAYEDTLIELNDTLVRWGFNVIAGCTAIAEHSILRQYGTGRPDEDDRKILVGFADRIREKLQLVALGKPVIPGNRPYKPLGGHPYPTTTDECISCRVCAEMCPAEAIDIENPSKLDGEKCIGCMRCISVCPMNAKLVPPETLAALDARIGKFLEERKEPELFL